MLTLEDVDTARAHPNVQAAAWAIRYGEGTQADDGWRILYGGGRFWGKDNQRETVDDYADHPRKVVHAAGRDSSAAGAFQIIQPTWDTVVLPNAPWLKDEPQKFSPTNQERAFVILLHYRHALEDVLSGRVMDWIKKLGDEWASLPGSKWGRDDVGPAGGQPTVDITEVVREYRAAGGRFEDEGHIPIPVAPTAAPEPAQSPSPAPAEPPPTPRTETPAPIPVVQINEVGAGADRPPSPRSAAMLPWIPLVLPHLIGLVPQLARLFSSGSATNERNIAAAEIVVNMAKEAIGARNEQELVERIQADPASAAKVKETIEKNYFRVEEVGGGVAAARAYSLAVSGAGGSPGDEHRTIPLSAQPTFIITCALILLVFVVVGVVLVPWEIWNRDGKQIYSDELRLVVVTSILGALATVTAFWLGSSFGSQKKDDQQRIVNAAAAGLR